MKMMKTVTGASLISMSLLSLVVACGPQSRFRAPVVRDGKIKLEEAGKKDNVENRKAQPIAAPTDKPSIDFAENIKDIYVFALSKKTSNTVNYQVMMELKQGEAILLKGELEENKLKAELNQFKRRENGSEALVKDDKELTLGTLTCETASCEDIVITLESKKDEALRTIIVNTTQVNILHASATFNAAEEFNEKLKTELVNLGTLRQLSTFWSGSGEKVSRVVGLISKEKKNLLFLTASTTGLENLKSFNALTLVPKMADMSLRGSDGKNLVKEVSTLEGEDKEQKISTITLTVVDTNSKRLDIGLTLAVEVAPEGEKELAPLESRPTTTEIVEAKGTVSASSPADIEVEVAPIASPTNTVTQPANASGRVIEAQANAAAKPKAPKVTPQPIAAAVEKVESANADANLSQIISTSELYCTYSINNEPDSLIEVFYNTKDVTYPRVVQMKVKKLDRTQRSIIRVDRGSRGTNYIQATTCLSELTFVKNNGVCSAPYFEMIATSYSKAGRGSCTFDQKNSGTDAQVQLLEGNKALLGYSHAPLSAITGNGIGQGYYKFSACGNESATRSFIDGSGSTKSYKNLPFNVFVAVTPAGVNVNEQCKIGTDLTPVK